MNGLAIIGNCCADLYIPPHVPPPPGGIERIPRPRVELGGNGANTAVTAARLGVPTALAGVLGDDLFGKHLRQLLKADGIDLSLLETKTDCGAPVTLVLNDQDGERSFVHHGGSNDAWELPADTLARRWEIFHMAAPELLGTFWPGPCLDAARRIRKAGIKLSLDVFVCESAVKAGEDPAEAHAPLLELADMVFPNEAEARAITGRDTAEDILSCLHDMGIHIAVIKRGDRGAIVSWDGRVEEVPAARVTAVDTCGAGDNFVGAFLAGLTRGLDPLECARLGCELGTLCVQRKGSVSASSDAGKLGELLERYGIS